MKKKLTKLIVTSLIISLVNTGMLLYLVSDNVITTIQNRPVVISRDYDKGQSMEKALQTKKPVIVWFYTDWCRYCQKLAPTFKKLTKDRQIKKEYAIAYVNAEDPRNKECVKEYKVEGYPTVYLVKEGKKEFISPVDLLSPFALDVLKAKFLEFVK